MKRSNARPYPQSFDGYLRYAIQTKFAYFASIEGGRPPTVILLVELKRGVDVEEFVKKMLGFGLKEVFANSMELSDQPRMPTRFLTIRGPVALVEEPTWSVWDSLTSFVELSLPIQPGQGAGIEPFFRRRPKSRSDTVLAIIDDGCAFAHEHLRVNPAQHFSRVFAIWDQNTREPSPVPGSPGLRFGRKLKSYGIEYWRNGAKGKQIGIDAWIALHQTPGGGVDEDACYARAGFKSLSQRATHGTHVMDVFAGRVPPGARLSIDPTQPPTFADALPADTAGQGGTDIIFVQIPQAAVDDASGKWLSAQVSDGLLYIMSCVDTNVCRRVIVNLSYGPTTEPHDGKANLENRMSEFTAFYDGNNVKTELNIILPSGNSHLSDGHLCWKSRQAAETKQWVWRLPPDNPVPVFVELWVPKAHAGDVSGRLLAPSPYQSYSAQLPVITVTPGTPDSYGWVITLPPTQAVPLEQPPGATPTAPQGVWPLAPTAGPPVSPGHWLPAPHGDWTIEVTLQNPHVELNAYVARSDPNMGSRVLAKQSFFVDPVWEAARGGFAEQTLVNGVEDITGSLICREGTLNGIATASDPRILVAGGYRVFDQRCCSYSSVGPSRAKRNGPDYALPTDESAALEGIRAAGTRSGATFRLIGTSTAAPQLARLQAGAAPPGPCLKPIPSPDLGCGPLPPP